MKKCIYHRKSYYGLMICKATGTSRNECPKIGCCKYFRPTLRYRLFGKWWNDVR